nr:hypothetical protein [Tanacetum cinerariifolium]
WTDEREESFEKLKRRLVSALILTLPSESNLMLQIKEAKKDNDELWAIMQNVEDGKHTEFSVDDDGVVKIEHQRASGLLQPLEIPMWKWVEISMDFVTGLPTTQKRHDAIWVAVDRLTKSAHFLPIRK